MPKSLYLMMVARALIGFGHGYAYLTVLVHASEIVTQKLRGMLIATLNFVTISSILVCGAVTMGFDNDKHGFGAMQTLGVLGAIYSIMGFILMVRLRCESTETWSIKNEYNELKAMVEEDEESSTNVFEGRNERPLLLITLLKIASVLSFNFGLNMIRLQSTTFFVSEGINYTMMILMTVRMLAAAVTLFTIDAKGRKIHFIVAFGGTSVIMILMGILIAYSSDTDNLVLLILHILFEIFGGFGIGMIADVYASEAFNTVKKPNSIMFTTSIEFLLHAFLIFITFNAITTKTFNWIFLVGSGILIMIITAFLHKKLPETAKMSIRQTRTEFLKSGEIVFSGTKIPAQNITFS
jgi:hypothetical protein